MLLYLLEFFIAEKHPLLYCPTGAKGPYEPTSITFFNITGLCDTLCSLGITVNKIYFLKSRNLLSKLKYFLLKITPSFIIKMFIKNKEQFKYRALPGRSLPANRATLICSVSASNVSQSQVKYWDGVHKYHTDGIF